MPPTDTTADRVMMRLAEAIYRRDEVEPSKLNQGDWIEIHKIAAALSSHGLREPIEAVEFYAKEEAIQEPFLKGYRSTDGRATRALTALLGDGETLKVEEQTDGE